MSDPTTDTVAVSRRSATARADDARMGTPEQVLIVCDDNCEKADKAALKALRNAFPPGARIYWYHGEHTRAGTVVEVLGHSYETARIRYENDEGKVCDVNAFHVVAWLKGSL